MEPGITCVVGPNGSGKSNVVDALTWVMGEQGAKSLRGSNMADVIFMGTASRQPLGRAEVSLTIDNTDGVLPIEYTEVTIQRTMFRGGTSEYSINGTSSRLRDVQDLLSDTGMGRQMHVIVGQGQLNEVLGSSPLERRGFIEEAAGVLKHRVRKERALRKLDNLAVNLTRLSDITNDLSRQLGPLARQAATARKAQMIQAIVRDAGARLLANELEEILERHDSQQRNEEDLKARIAEVAAKIDAHNAQLANLQEELDKASPQLETLTQIWQGLTETLGNLRGIKNQSAERVVMMSKPVSGLERDTEALESRLHKAEAELEKLGEEKSAAEETLEALRGERTAADQREESLQKEIAAAYRVQADQRESLQKLRGKVETSGQLVEDAKGRLEGLQEELQQAQAALVEAQQSLADANIVEVDERGAAQAQKAHEAASAAVIAARARVDELSESEKTLTAELATWQAREETLQRSLQPKDASGELLEAKLPGVQGSIGDYIEVEAEWAEAVAAIFGVWADAILVDSVGVAVDSIRQIRSGSGGQVRLVVAAGKKPAKNGGEKLPQGCKWALEVVSPRQGSLPAGVAAVLAESVVCPDLTVARTLVEKGTARVCATTSGEMLSPTLVSASGLESTSVLALRAEYDEACEQSASAGEALQKAQAELVKARDELAEAEVQAAAALSSLRESDALAAEAAQQGAALKAAVGSAQAQVTRAEKNLAEAQENLENRQAAAQEAQAALQAAESSQQAEAGAGLEEQLADLEAALSQAQESAREALDKETNARLVLRVVEERIKAEKNRVESLQRNLKEEKESLLRSQEEERLRLRRLQVAQYVEAQATAALEAAQRALEQAAAGRSGVQESRSQLEKTVATLRGELEEMVKARSQLEDAFHRDEVLQAQSKMRREHLEARAQAEFGLEADELLKEFGGHTMVPVFDENGETTDMVPFVREEQTSRLEKANRDLERLGKVNPLALADYEALQQRHKFLADQLNDLKKSRDDLLEIVAEMDKQVETVFAEAFEKVKQAFDRVFTQLFPGGEGRLILTDPNDMLQTGIEIEARPAGKRVKHLSLLSGGEKSLAALAFLFSIFQACPSPFYVLDEIEAALDDANLSRLLDVLKDLRKTSQLIIITHHKRTMEIADSLYGITMRDGVTSVVSQRLDEV